jgi:hypothetical protein
MMDANRIGPAALAWSEADPQAIFNQMLALMMALSSTLWYVRRSAYAGYMKDDLDRWQAILEAVPPDKPTT